MAKRRWATATVAGAAAIAGTLIATPHAQAAPRNLKLVATKQSLLAKHYWYKQTYRGHPVLGGFYATHVDRRTGKTTVTDGRVKVSGLAHSNAAVGADRARSLAAARSHGRKNLRATLSVVPGSPARLAWEVLDDTGHGSVRTVVDADNGKVLSSKSMVKEIDGTGKVFSPNAVVTLQNESLTDNSNADSAVFGPAYKTVTLKNLDGTGYLRGPSAYNVSKKQVSSSSNSFLYNRSQDGFEQTMAYHAITSTQEYIQSLGFSDVNNEPQDYRTTGLTADNSNYDGPTDKITFGTGGVDDAEDAEVIWHEYGHAIQDAQVPDYGTTKESSAIGEGFGDYWAYTNSKPVSQDTATTPLACIGDWDATSYTSTTPHCLRRVDGTKHYPQDMAGEVHADGEIWSRALYDIHAALGRTESDTLILESQFSYAPNTTFAAAAQATVNAANSLYGAAAADSVRTAFVHRGIL
ncbi:M36 family metallopeptidase [Streptomyces sioyaensis]|uniref:M36 family metallopeptidase n=1 Tax=Streptomyces sioyaensis TaxID=67364 RepID=UPI003D7454F3